MNPYGDAGGAVDAEHERFAHDDAAYLLGGLEPDQARAFEAHAAGCPLCSANLAALRPVLGALGQVSEADLAVPEPPPSLLPELVQRAEARRRRQRRLLVGLGGLAAACVVALAVVVGVSVAGGSSSGSGSGTGGTALVAVGQSPVEATATLTSKHWGTEIDLDCRYLTAAATNSSGAAGSPDNDGTYGATAGSARALYSLRVLDTSGDSHDLGSWTLGRTSQTKFSSGVGLPEAQIRSVQILDAAGQPVLQLNR